MTTVGTFLAAWRLGVLLPFFRRKPARRPAVVRFYRTVERGDSDCQLLLSCNRLTAERKAAQEAAARAAAAGPLFSGGRALVLVKSAIVERDYKALGLRLSGPRTGVNFGGESGYAAGKAAGDRATFGRPVNGGGGVRHIGQG